MTAPNIDRRGALGSLTALGAAVVGCRRVDESTTHSSAAREEPTSAGGAARIQRIVPSVEKREGRGALVSRVFPTPHLRHLDPFVLLDDFAVREPAGFPRHPHRGFEAFTYMLEGAFHHRDDLGNDSVVGAGGTQRFTSGRGAYHSEMPATTGDNHGLQLWVNLPRHLKQMPPSYAPTAGLDVPEHDRRGAYVRQVAGANSPVALQTEVDYLDLTLESGSHFARTIAPGHNAVIYVISGAVRLLGHQLVQGRAALPTPGDVELDALEFSRVLWLAGRPHGQPIIHRGPFVD